MIFMHYLSVCICFIVVGITKRKLKDLEEFERCEEERKLKKRDRERTRRRYVVICVSIVSRHVVQNFYLYILVVLTKTKH